MSFMVVFRTYLKLTIRQERFFFVFDDVQYYLMYKLNFNEFYCIVEYDCFMLSNESIFFFVFFGCILNVLYIF